MTEQKDTPKEESNAKHVSAPELPLHVAREYGLHHDAAASTEPKEVPSVADDPTLDTAVDDIVAKESDELLAAQDGTHPATAVALSHRGFWKKLGHLFVAWWRNKRARWATIIIFVLAAGALSVIPTTRYTILNTVGVRSSASVIVLDNTNGLPLKNVAVSMGRTTVKTDIEGKAKITNLRLGKTELTIKRIAFAPYNKKLTIGWGSNPLGEYKLRAVGTQFVLYAVDFLSGKPIEGVEAVSDGVNALSDKQGKVVLTVEDTNVTTLPVSVGSAGYRKEALTLNAAVATATTVQLVPDQKAVFVSRESGKYDVYTADLDGKNRKLLLAGTGSESSNMSLAVSPDGAQAALVSTRDNVRDSDGYVLQALTFINIRANTSVTVDHAQQIQLVDWTGNRLIYRTTIAGASAANPQRNRLVSYNYDSNARLQLATANQFNLILSARGSLYYAASSTDPGATLGLFKVKADGSGRERLSTQEAWAGLRTSYDSLSIQTPEGWYTYDLAVGKLDKTAPPTNFASYAYTDDPQSQRTVWTDTRDGKGVLLLRSLQNTKATTLVTQPGLTYPVRWAGKTAVIYRVVTSGESAEYVVNPDGGLPRKIADVTAAYGYMQAY